MGVSLLHNLLVRELALVAVLVIVLISFYIRYTHAAHKEFVRTRERRMALVVRSARRQLAVVLVLLAAVLVYDRVLPHWGIGASAARQSATSSVKHEKIAVSSSSKHHASSKLSTASKKASSNQAKASSKADADSRAKASASMIAASKSAASARLSSSAASANSASAASASSLSAAQASSQAASRAAASSSAAKAKSVDPKTQAASTVQAYLAQHPDAVSGRVDRVGVIEYGSDYNGVPAYQVGLYQTQGDGSSVAVHMYFVYAGGNLAKAY